MSDKKKKRATNPKSKSKDAQLIIRISKDERKAFVDLCDELDTSAAREIRHFIRSFVSRHQQAGDMLSPASDEANALVP